MTTVCSSPPKILRHRERIVAACAELAVGIEHRHGLVGGTQTHADLTRPRPAAACATTLWVPSRRCPQKSPTRS